MRPQREPDWSPPEEELRDWKRYALVGSPGPLTAAAQARVARNGRTVRIAAVGYAAAVALRLGRRGSGCYDPQENKDVRLAEMTKEEAK